MAEEHRKLHAIMICLPYQGHINPFVNLALKLASKGFAITFVHFEFIHHKLSEAHYSINTSDVDFFREARESGLDIRYKTMSDGFPLEFDRDVHIEEYWESLLRDFPARADEFVANIIQSDQGLVQYFLVADTSYSWCPAIAKKYNLVSVSLWTEPALVFSLIYHWELLKENGHFCCCNPGFKEVQKADFILHNTVHELEFDTFSALDKYQPNYAIGPINFSKNLPTSTVSKSLWSESNCNEWLDSKLPGSVLYVSFGSFVQTSKQVIEEIAYGLLLSEVHFIWVVRAGIVSYDDSNILPQGFEDEIKDKGLIIPWCNQITVLSHSAVGGFLTHCGWNLTIESMWCGVPMICYPVNYDQPTNRKLVVDDWKIGINLCDGKSVDRKDVCEKIRNFMNGAISKGFRLEANKVRETLRNALEDHDGSSEKNFDQFVDDLKDKIIM